MSDAASLTRDADAYDNSRGINLYLKVYINGTPQARLGHFRLRDGQLYATRSAIERLGFVLPATTPDLVALDSLKGVKVAYNAARQKLDIMAPLSLLDLGITTVTDRQPVSLNATASPGLLVNYNLRATRSDDGDSTLNSFSEQRLFGPFGNFSNTLLTTIGDTLTGWQTGTVRLNSSWRSYLPKHMITVTAGDSVTGALPWTRSLRIGGLTISRDFSLQPYRTTVPLQSFLGKAVVPSRVELYVNGLRQFTGEVPVGPFELNVTPTTGATTNARLVVTNALGQVSTRNFRYYSSSNLLKPGLSDWSASLGFVRQAFGIDSFNYGDEPAVSGFGRYGLTDGLTGGLHLEATLDLVNAGFGAVWLLGYYGVMNASLSASRYNDITGRQASLGYNWFGGDFGFGFDVQTAGENYRDIGSLYGAPIPERTVTSNVSFSPAQAGSFGLSYVALRQSGQEAAQFLNANWYKTFGNFSLGVNLSKNLNRDDGVAASLSLSWYPASDTNYYAAARHTPGNRRSEYSYSVGAANAAPADGGFGWRVQANDGAQRSGYAQASYLGRYGRVSGGVNALGNERHYFFANATGSLVFMNADLFPARRVNQAFAVVSTNGVANVPITRENIVVGKTNDSGNLLVTNLRPWQKNHLGIKSLRLPANMRFGKVETAAVPRGSSGVLVEFQIEEVRAALITLVDADGAPLPVGSIAHANGKTGQGQIVGYGGILYLEDLERKNTVEVTTPEGERCRVRFTWHSQDNSIPHIGPLACTPERSR